MTNRIFAAIAAVCLLGLIATSSRADDAKTKTGFIDRAYKDADGKEIPYVVFVPHDYTGDKECPAILFLHGAGETKGSKKMPVEVGIGTAIKHNEKSFPFITVIPQAQTRGWAADSANGKMAMAMLAEVEKAYKIDPKRIYLTGLSMGGMGTWSFAVAHPDKWAAIVPICGPGDASKAATIKDLPCWCFWGDQDGFANKSMPKMIDALKEAGGKPKSTEYPGVGHNSWDKAYATKELWDWLLEQKRK
jgi:predicted peptidase